MATLFMPQGTPQSNEPSPPRTRSAQGHVAQTTLLNQSPNLVSASQFMLNPNTRLRLNAPRIQARTIEPPQVTAPRYTAEERRDILGPSIASLGESIGHAAIRVADKRATLESAEAVNSFNDTARSLWLGAPDGKGGFSPGYAATNGKDAAQGFSSFQAAIDKTRNDIAVGLGDAARAKFLTGSNGTYTNYLNQAANHAQGGQIQWEKDEISKAWNNAYQQVDDRLTTGDIPGAIALMDDTLTQLQQSVHISPSEIPETQQQLYREMADFMSSRDDASSKLAMLETTLSDRFDLKTATHYSKALQTAVADENRRADAAIAREERSLRLARDKNNLALFDLVSGGSGGEVNWEEQRRLAAAGKLSTSVYIDQRNRYLTKGYLGAIPPDEEIRIKREILEGTAELDQVLGLQYDDASVRRIGNFFVSAQDQKQRADLSYGFTRIASTFSSKLKGYNTQDLALVVTQAQADYERLLREKPPAEALQIVQQSYLANYVPTISPMVVLPKGIILDLNTLSPHEAALEVERAELAEELTEEEADDLYNQIEAFEQRGVN